MDNNNFNNICYIDGSSTIHKFIPQENIKLIKEFDPLLYFPNINNVNLTKLQISNIGIYSITDPNLAYNILEDIKKFIKVDLHTLTITDAFANCGGMSITFCNNFKHVNSCEIIKIQCKILNNNLKVYGFDNYKIYCNDYFDIYNIKNDIIFFDPPWGKNYHKTTVLGINNINILCLIQYILSNTNTKLCILLIHPTFDISQINKFISIDIKYHISKIKFFSIKKQKKSSKIIIYFNKKTNSKIKYRLVKY